jgi:hypothetical protein
LQLHPAGKNLYDATAQCQNKWPPSSSIGSSPLPLCLWFTNQPLAMRAKITSNCWAEMIQHCA